MQNDGNIIEAPILGNLATKMPSIGNVINTSPLPGANGGELSPEEKLRAAEELIAKQEAEKKAAEGANGKTGPDDKGSDGDQEPTAEEIQAKLDELSKKAETELTDEDKVFVQKYTQEPVDEITTVKKGIEETYGVKLEGTYENSPEGLKAIMNEVAPVLAEQMFVQALERVPYMKDFYSHVVQEGKSIETFLAKNTKPVFESIELKDVSDVEDATQKAKLINNQKQMIQLDLKSKGLSDEDITTFIDLFEAKGELYNKSLAAKTALKANHQAQIESQLKAEEARIEAENKKQQDLIKEVETIITTNDYDGVQIPAADVQAFKDAMLKPIDKDGYTLIDYKRAKLTLKQRALIDYIVFKDLKSIALSKKETAKAFNFKQAAKDNENREPKLANISVSNGNPKLNIKTIDFNTLVKPK